MFPGSVPPRRCLDYHWHVPLEWFRSEAQSAREQRATKGVSLAGERIVRETIRLAASAAPMWLGMGLDATAAETPFACRTGVVLVLIVMPWRYVVEHYGRSPCGRWTTHWRMIRATGRLTGRQVASDLAMDPEAHR